MRSKLSYSRWKRENRSLLESLPGKEIFMFFSGGTDSSVAMDFLLKAGKDFGFVFTAHAGAFPVHRYADTEKQRIGSYWRDRGVNIIWHLSEETDKVLRSAEDPCLMCRTIRKQMLNEVVAKAAHNLENMVLITGYSLWDIVSYSIEHILSDLVSSSDIEKEGKKSDRFIETSQRFYSLFKMKEGYTVFRPLVRYNNRDIQAILKGEVIPTLSVPCEFSDFRPKRILEKYYEKMGGSFDYDRVFTLSLIHI